MKEEMRRLVNAIGDFDAVADLERRVEALVGRNAPEPDQRAVVPSETRRRGPLCALRQYSQLIMCARSSSFHSCVPARRHERVPALAATNLGNSRRRLRAPALPQ